jgi:hypothetical protein
MADFMGTGLTKRQVEKLDVSLTLGGAAALGMSGRLFDPWVEEWLKEEVPFKVTANELVEMYGHDWAEFFVGHASIKFDEIKMQTAAWWSWFYGLTDERACEVVVTRLKALVYHAVKSDLKPLTEQEIKEIYG